MKNTLYEILAKTMISKDMLATNNLFLAMTSVTNDICVIEKTRNSNGSTNSKTPLTNYVETFINEQP
nr:hypothetical protein [uncultured Lachnoclostridium sp.]